MAALFSELVKVAREVESKKSRTEKVRVLSSFFQTLTPEDARIAALLLSGRVFPEGDERELGVGFTTIYSVVKQLKSARIVPLAPEPPSLQEVYFVLDKISRVTGEGSRDRKVSLLRGLFSLLTEEELEYLVRIIFGEVRIGANVGVLLEAFAKLGGYTISEVQRAYALIGDIGEVARRVAAREDLRSVKLELFRPVKPMLAEMAYTPLEVLREHVNRTSVEWKYDGVRVQVHFRGGRVEVFSRRLNRLTEYLPDVVEKVKEHLRAEEAVLDGEAVGVVDGKPLSFQDLVRRVRRKNDKWSFLRSVPFQVYFFDVLYLDGRSLLEAPYEERRKLLEQVLPDELLARQAYVESIEDLERAFREALERGHEGVMCKRPDSAYEPGMRRKSWLKLKKADTLDCVIVAAEWGHGRRTGWLSDYYLAVRDENTGKYVVVGKTFKGLTDAEFEEMTRRLLSLKTGEAGWVVYVKPQVVVEVEYSEIQRSPRYDSGFALRFARIKRIRPDKNPEEVTTLGELRRRFQQQKKARAPGG